LERTVQACQQGSVCDRRLRRVVLPPHSVSDHDWSGRLQAALTGVTAAVVGVIGNLAVYLGLRVLFPDNASFDTFAALLAIASFVALRRFIIQTYYLVPIGSLAGMGRVILGMH
jgi:hypothetical protein